MKTLAILFYFICLSALSQVEATLIDKTELHAETIFGIDNYETIYYKTSDETFLKRSKDTTITYANFQLGKISSANVFNPLKINLFYGDFNTVVILDNRLAEITRIDFNTNQPYKNISFLSTGFDNTLWLYNQDTQQLELYDFRSNTTRVKTVPISDTVLDLKSDYNNCYLLTEDFLYIYSYFGTQINKIKNQGYIKMAFNESKLILQGEIGYFILSKRSNEIIPVASKDLFINQFLVTNQTLYLYRDNLLYRYQLKTD